MGKYVIGIDQNHLLHDVSLDMKLSICGAFSWRWHCSCFGLSGPLLSNWPGRRSSPSRNRKHRSFQSSTTLGSIKRLHEKLPRQLVHTFGNSRPPIFVARGLTLAGELPRQ